MWVDANVRAEQLGGSEVGLEAGNANHVRLLAFLEPKQSENTASLQSRVRTHTDFVQASCVRIFLQGYKLQLLLTYSSPYLPT